MTKFIFKMRKKTNQTKQTQTIHSENKKAYVIPTHKQIEMVSGLNQDSTISLVLGLPSNIC